jgi:hypothetical protein
VEVQKQLQISYDNSFLLVLNIGFSHKDTVVFFALLWSRRMFTFEENVTSIFAFSPELSLYFPSAGADGETGAG